MDRIFVVCENCQALSSDLTLKSLFSHPHPHIILSQMKDMPNKTFFSSAMTLIFPRLKYINNFVFMVIYKKAKILPIQPMNNIDQCIRKPERRPKETFRKKFLPLSMIFLNRVFSKYFLYWEGMHILTFVFRCDNIYRVIIKEGQKVNAYYEAKTCLLGAFMGFITTCGHLIIYSKDLKYFTSNAI